MENYGNCRQFLWEPSISTSYTFDVGIYKRKQESKKTRTRSRKRSRKKEKKNSTNKAIKQRREQELDQESDQENKNSINKKKKLSIFS